MIKELGMIFTEFGRPFVLKSDNGPCYSSKEFHDFLEFYQVHHITSSPHYPQSNGFAEALVGHFEEVDGKESQGWKTIGIMASLSTGLPQCQETFHHPLEALTGHKPRTSLPQIPSSVGKSDGNFQNSPGITEKATQYF